MHRTRMAAIRCIASFALCALRLACTAVLLALSTAHNVDAFSFTTNGRHHVMPPPLPIPITGYTLDHRRRHHSFVLFSEKIDSMSSTGINGTETANGLQNPRETQDGEGDAAFLESLDPIITANKTMLEVKSFLSLDDYEANQINTERIRTRICEGRTYARPDAFRKENIQDPPTLDDLLPMPVSRLQNFYTTSIFRVLVFVSSFVAFPYIAQFADQIVDISPKQLNDIVSKFVPGVTILYGTMISLTLSLLYARQRDIQNIVAKESSLLSIVFRNLISLFKYDRDLLVEAGKCVSDQVRTMVRTSRGKELMAIIYADPYARIVDLIDQEEERIAARSGNFMRRGPLLTNCRDLINQLTSIRAERLSQESNSLSPTHFQLLNVLTILILIGYILSVLPTLDELGRPSNACSMLFGVLCCLYVVFSLFADDLNEPFFGVYQLRRSASASHFLTIKWIIANHPWLRDTIDFEDCMAGDTGDWIKVDSPSIGEIFFETSQPYSDFRSFSTDEDTINIKQDS